MKTDERGGFEERLLAELRQVVTEHPEPATTPAAQPAVQRRFGWKPRLALAAAGVAAGVAAALATPLILDGDANPAHAVTVRDDGTVRVEIIAVRNAEDADELERALEEVGVPAEVDYLPWGTQCQRPEYESARDVRVGSSVEENSDGNPDSLSPRLVAILDPKDFKKDRTLVIEAYYNSKASKPRPGSPAEPNGLMSIGVAKGPVEPCEAS